jgi:glycosyltransferase involved in cell wall biosynthesis
MMCGVPVVATAVNSVPEIVVPGRTGLLARPRDPGSLAHALRAVLADPARAARMAARARVHIGRRFHPAVLGADLEEVYEMAREHGSARLSGAARRGEA